MSRQTGRSATVTATVGVALLAGVLTSATPMAGASSPTPEQKLAVELVSSNLNAEQLRQISTNGGLDPVVGANGSLNSTTLASQVNHLSLKSAKKRSLSPSGWTVPVKKHGISAVFGQAGGWSSGHHTGLDFTASEGTPVLAASSGRVIASEYEGAYGNIVKIRHADGIETWYAHLSGSKVSKGDRVEVGDMIGRVGMTGRTSGPHLHFEVRKKDRALDPVDYIWTGKKIPAKTKRG